MKQKIYNQVLNGCEDCPDRDVNIRDHKAECLRTIPRKKLPTGDPSNDFHIQFPEWCPLEDFDLYWIYAIKMLITKHEPNRKYLIDEMEIEYLSNIGSLNFDIYFQELFAKYFGITETKPVGVKFLLTDGKLIIARV